MANKRASALLSILKGLLAAAAVTLLGMALIAALVLTARLSDGVLTLLNQLLKALAVVLGVRAAVERGGNRGFFTGMTVALAYMIAGYGLYVALGGGRFEAAQMLGEMLLGAAVGWFLYAASVSRFFRWTAEKIGNYRQKKETDNG